MVEEFWGISEEILTFVEVLLLRVEDVAQWFRERWMSKALMIIRSVHEYLNY